MCYSATLLHWLGLRDDASRCSLGAGIWRAEGVWLTSRWLDPLPSFCQPHGCHIPHACKCCHARLPPPLGVCCCACSCSGCICCHMPSQQPLDLFALTAALLPSCCCLCREPPPQTNTALSSGRRKRAVPAGTATAEQLATYTLTGSFPLHKTTQPGITALALHPTQVGRCSGRADWGKQLSYRLGW